VTLGITFYAITLDEKSAATYEDLTSKDHVKERVQNTGIDLKIKNRIFGLYFTTKDIGERIGRRFATVFGLVQKS